MVLQAGETIQYFGQTYSYVGESSNPDYVIVKDSNGKEKVISKESLRSGSVWNFEPDPDIVARYENTAQEAHEAGLAAKEQRKTFKQQMLSYMDSLGLNFKHQLDAEQSKIYSDIEHQYYAANMDATAASNRERSAYTDLFIYLT